ncbi:oxidoreductase [Kaistia sp. 32K]|uniref:zinc-binding dehydrogenase n=1 Tax=Kaistia sp. 32K TaxID=2795690 RepID=UPI001915BB74|nr:zinc-binding dehydrogenase [Kaistia sp. 32K]BCP54240.1 oxidoreductase [Kaistia sp. 32K]
MLVEVEAFSLNRPDFLWLAAPNSQWRVGIDFVGKVVEPPRDGAGPAVGDRVMVHAPQGGGGAEFAIARPELSVVVPPGVGSAVAAALPLAGLVALRLVREARIKAGQRVLITGATGGVGHFAVELALNAGASVTALARSGEKTELLEQRGAKVIHTLDGELEPFDIILESIGGPVLTKALSKLVRKGLVLWFGAASGQPVQIDFFSFFPDRSSFTLKHFVYNEVEGDLSADLHELLELVATGVLNPHVSRIEDWSQTAEILKAIQQGTLAGKAVLTLKTPA